MDDEYWELEDMEQIDQVKIVFGMVNLKAMEEEKIARVKDQNREIFLQKIEEKAELDKTARQILSARIEVSNIDSAQSNALVEFLASQFTLQELESALPADLYLANISNKARSIIIKRAVGLAIGIPLGPTKPGLWPLGDRIEMANINSERSNGLVKQIAAKYTLEELLQGQNTLQKSELLKDVSADARDIIIQRAIGVARGIPIRCLKTIYFLLGDCGDALQLRCAGDSLDVIDHYPIFKKKKKIIGLCCNAPILVLGLGKKSIKWDTLLQTDLLPGNLRKGEDVKIIYLSQEEHEHLLRQGSQILNIEKLRKLAAESAANLQKLLDEKGGLSLANNPPFRET
jgi:hypothetical protein